MESIKKKYFNRKFLLIFLGILSLGMVGIGITFGFWMYTEKQNTFDVLGVKCFELALSDESDGIHLEEAYPVTDEEGKSQNGYTFTITNTCNTIATYQVNLEEKKLADGIKRLSNEYIKVSLNDSKGKKLNTYESTEATIKEANFTSDVSHKLTMGSLGPGKAVTYTLKLWMDYDTPVIDAVMNATFESKISVIATYIEEEKLKNNITIAYTEQEDYSNEKETITFTVKSAKEDVYITEYSFDGKTFEPIELVEGKPSSTVIVPLDFTEAREYTVYFKDSLGNIQQQTLTPNKLDKESPVINDVYVGSMIYKDPKFETSMNGTHVYNGLENGNLIITREQIDTPYGHTYGLILKNIGEAYPGLGGFTFATSAEPNHNFITRIVAKIPVGYSLQFNSNYLGTNPISKWLTANRGTGDWAEYVFYVRVGSDGNSTGTNFFNLAGANGSVENPVIWQVAYATVFDIGVYEDENYVIVTGSDNSKISQYGMNQSEIDEPSYCPASYTSGFAALLPDPIKSNGTYNVWLKDLAGNVTHQSFNVPTN